MFYGSAQEQVCARPMDGFTLRATHGEVIRRMVMLQVGAQGSPWRGAGAAVRRAPANKAGWPAAAHPQAPSYPLTHRSPTAFRPATTTYRYAAGP